MKKWMITIIVAAVITTIAFASDSIRTQASNPAESPATTEKKKEMISLQEAKEIALQEVDGIVKEIQLNKDDEKFSYEVDIHDGTFEYELEVDAFTGEIIDFEKDADKKSVEKYGSLLSMDEAIVIAQKEAPNASLIEVEIGENDDRIVFEIDMHDDEFNYEIDVDASTGEIVDIEKEQIKKSGKKSTTEAKSNEVEVLELTTVSTDDKQAKPKAEKKTDSTTKPKAESKPAPKAEPKPEKKAEKKAEKKSEKKAEKKPKKKSTITMDEAVAIAKQHGSGVVTEVERDDGVYEIEMEDGNIEYEIEISIYTGEVVSFEKDTDD